LLFEPRGPEPASGFRRFALGATPAPARVVAHRFFCRNGEEQRGGEPVEMELA
jgi:hypothetical protein